MKKILLFSLILLSLACKKTPDSKLSNETYIKAVKEFYPLLDRNEKIQNGKEWEHAQSQYGQLREQIIKNPDDQEAKIQLAELFIQEARITGEHPHYYPMALDLFTKASLSENNDLNFRALSGKATVELSLHNFQAALETAQKAIAMNPYNAYIYGVMVDAHVELGKYDKAVEFADRMMSIRPDLRSYSRVSYLREIHGMHEEALEAMKLAIQAGIPGSEDRAWAMITYAELLDRDGKADQAKEVFQQILIERENYPFAIGALADVAITEGKYDEAEKMLNDALAIIPEVGFSTSLAKLYKLRNQKDSLTTAVPKILNMIKEDADRGHFMDLELAHFHLEITEDLQKAMEHAMIEYNKRPENIDVNRVLAQIYSKLGDSEKLKFHLGIASKTGSRHPDLVQLKKLHKNLS